MRYIVIPVTPIRQNCTLIIDEKTNRAAVSDPGGDIESIAAELGRQGVELERILVTHGHQDHCGRAKDLADLFGVPIDGPHRDALPLVARLDFIPPYMPGLPRNRSFRPDRWLEQGDVIHVGSQKLQVFHCPGHTPGHVVYYDAPTGILIAGDVLFAGSIGRTDLPGSSYESLERSIRENLYPLPSVTRNGRTRLYGP